MHISKLTSACEIFSFMRVFLKEILAFLGDYCYNEPIHFEIENFEFSNPEHRQIYSERLKFIARVIHAMNNSQNIGEYHMVNH